MTATGDTGFLLPPGQIGELANNKDARLLTRFSLPDPATPCWLLDCFDEALGHANEILLMTDEVMELILADGQILSQPLDQPFASRQAGAAPGPAPLANDLPPGPVTKALRISSLRRLLPVAAGQVRRGELSLIDDEGKSRARVQLRVFTGFTAEDLAFACLHRLRGYDRATTAMQQLIADCGGQPLQEGELYRRLLPGHPQQHSKADLQITGDEAAFDAANDIIDALLPVIRANEAGIIDDLDSEFLHDYRVVLRKIRSVVSLFKDVYSQEQTDALRAEFRSLMAPTGRLRDLDVYLLERADFYLMVPEMLHPGLDRLFAMFTAKRETEQKQLSSHLKGRSYQRQINALVKQFAERKALIPGRNGREPAQDFACRLIWKRYRKITRIAAQITPASEDSEVHRLRIECKKLRYLIEFFGPLFESTALSAILKPLKRLQTTLGLFNDYSVQQISLQEFVLRLAGEDAAHKLEIAQSVGALVTVLHTRQLAERDKVATNIDHFTSPETEQTFRTLFHRGKDHS